MTCPEESVERQPASQQGLEEVSGISDEMSPSATGKLLCASLTGELRRHDPRFVFAILQAAEMPATARVYTERNGAGYSYCTIKYRTVDRLTGRMKQRSLYLGKLESGQARWLTAVLGEVAERQAWAGAGLVRLDHDRIRKLRALRRMMLEHARDIAKRAGYHFRGFRLMRRKTG